MRVNHSRIMKLVLLRRRVLTSYRLLKCKLGLRDVKVGKNASINENVHFTRRHKVRAGKNLLISRNAHMASNLQIGDDVMIGPYATFVGGEHIVDGIGDMPIRQSGVDDYKLTIIEDGAWVGCRSIIIAGVTIGKGAVVAAGATVTKDVPPYTIVGNGYAKEIRKRKM